MNTFKCYFHGVEEEEYEKKNKEMKGMLKRSQSPALKRKKT